jgi:hypothetical protein
MSSSLQQVARQVSYLTYELQHLQCLAKKTERNRRSINFEVSLHR